MTLSFKNYMTTNKFIYYFFLLCFFFFGRSIHVNGQSADVLAYQRAAGDYAVLYQGMLESEIDMRFWVDHPYMDNDEFQVGEVCFQNLVYKEIKMRYNIVDNQLIVASPHMNAKIVVDMNDVSWFTMTGKLFIPNEKKLCFDKQLFKGNHVSLFYNAQKKKGVPVAKDRKEYNVYDLLETFYMDFRGQRYIINRMKDIYKVFPEHKSALRKYVNRLELEFNSGYKQNSLQLVMSYLDTLLK